MNKHKSRYLFLFFGALGGVMTLGVAFSQEVSGSSWKEVGRKALLHIPAPEDTKLSSRLKHSYLGSFSRNTDLDNSIKTHFVKK